jgi:hypothetical protein
MTARSTYWRDAVMYAVVLFGSLALCHAAARGF